MKNRNILVAMQDLHGGTKHGAHMTRAQTEITREEAEKLGLDDGTIMKLLASGAIANTSVRAEGESLDVDGDLADGITLDEFRTFLEFNGHIVDPEASVDDLLAIRPELVVGDSLSSASMSVMLTKHGVEHDPHASPEALFAVALAHGVPEDIDAAAAKVERDMKVEAIRAELEKRAVPFETDANKPALARLLAQVRSAEPSMPVAEPPAA